MDSKDGVDVAMRQCRTGITAAASALVTQSRPTLRGPFNIITLDFQLRKQRIHIQALRSAEQQGLIRHDRLFPDKGRFASHEEVLDDLRQFEEWRWATWERSVLGLSEDETTRSYRLLLANQDPRYRLETWRQQAAMENRLSCTD
jgi:hypothetical protein